MEDDQSFADGEMIFILFSQEIGYKDLVLPESLGWEQRDLGIQGDRIQNRVVLGGGRAGSSREGGLPTVLG